MRLGKNNCCEEGGRAAGQRLFFVRWQYTQFVGFSLFPPLVHNDGADAGGGSAAERKRCNYPHYAAACVLYATPFCPVWAAWNTTTELTLFFRCAFALRFG